MAPPATLCFLSRPASKFKFIKLFPSGVHLNKLFPGIIHKSVYKNVSNEFQEPVKINYDISGHTKWLYCYCLVVFDAIELI